MKSTQSDHNMNFDGMESMAPSRSTKFSGNQHSGVQNPNKTINVGRGPTKGNTGDLAGRSCKPDTAAVPASIKIKNPDYINGGHQVRTPGGTRSFEPSATQNYKGNSDKINVGRGPTKGNQC